MLPPGAVVPPFEVLDAVHKGVLDGGHTAAAYWLGKNRAATLFGPYAGRALRHGHARLHGLDPRRRRLELYQEFYQKELQRNIVVMPMTCGGAADPRLVQEAGEELGRPEGPQVPRNRHHRRSVQQVRHEYGQHARRRYRSLPASAA